MPNVTLTLERAVTGTFSITFLESFVNASNQIVTTDPYTVAIANAATAVLSPPASNVAGVSALIECYSDTAVFDYFLQDGTKYGSTDATDSLFNRPVFQHTDSNWYTGQSPLVVGVNKLLTRVSRTIRRAIINPFNAIIPATAVNVKDLYSISATSTQADTSVIRVAEYMLSTPSLKAQLPKGINPRGAYDNAVFYVQNDGVTYNGSFWVYESVTSLAGQTPGVGSVWREYVSKGLPGGTGATSVGFDNTAWTNQSAAFKLEACSRGDALGLYGAIPQPDLSSYAQRSVANTWADTATFNGNVTFNSRADSPNLAQTINDTRIANTAYVRAAISALSTLKDVAIIEERQPTGTDAGSAVAGVNNRGLEFVTGNLTNFVSVTKPTVTITQPGNYLMIGMASAVATQRHRLMISRINNTAARLANGRSRRNPVPANALSDHGNDEAMVWGYYTTANNNDQIQLRHYCELATATVGLGRATNEAAQQEVFAQLIIFRL